MIGDSAGRSAGNRNGEGANRRNTQRERAHIDPVREQTEEVFLTRRGEQVVNVLSMICIVAFGCLGAILIAAWFGIL